MNNRTLWVPFSVLNDMTHSANTRLIWLLLCHQPAGASSAQTDIHLRKLSGLDAKTIATARARLIEAPLECCSPKPAPACAAIPGPLLTNAEISPGARLLYGQLQGVPQFESQGGYLTYADLSRLTGRSDDFLRRAAAELVASGWLTITQANRKSPLCFTYRNPVSLQMRARVSSLRRKVRRARPRGEALLREFLNLLIAVDRYGDNATPDFLLNPFTGELMELDRYYPAFGVAVEFNGAQHYEVTELATFEATVKQVGRDAMKAFICKSRGIDMVCIHPEDLRLKSIDQKLPSCLPRRDLAGQEPLLAALEEMASEYRERTAEERERKGRQPQGGSASR